MSPKKRELHRDSPINSPLGLKGDVWRNELIRGKSGGRVAVCTISPELAHRNQGGETATIVHWGKETWHTEAHTTMSQTRRSLHQRRLCLEAAGKPQGEINSTFSETTSLPAW